MSAASRLEASSAARRVARPQLQSLQARRRLPGWGRHSGASFDAGLSVGWLGDGEGERTLDDGTRHVGFGEEGVFVDELVVGIFVFFFFFVVAG